MISIESTGSFHATESWLKKLSSDDIFSHLSRYGQMGVDALSRNTPSETGLTANSWYYEIQRDRKSYSIIWGNTNVVRGMPIAVLIQVGHGTGTGGYVQGRDYINPALRPLFDQIADEVWKVVRAK